MKQHRKLAPAVALAALVIAPGASGKEDSSSAALTPKSAVLIAVRNNPGLESATLSEKQARQSVLVQEDRYPYTWQADGSYTRSVVPSLGQGDTINRNVRERYLVGTELRRTFPTGTSATMRVEGDRQTTSRQSAVIGSDSAGSTYGLSARASVTQPLLRGAGTDVNEQELRAARVNSVFAGKTKDRVASELVRDVLSAYWELWFAERNVTIDRAAKQLAETQRDAARERLARGSLAPVDVLPFETQVATLEERVVASEVTERQRELELEQLLGRSVGSPKTSGEPPSLQTVPTTAAIERKLAAGSPDLIELRERVRLARTRVTAAGDQFRPRLDLSGWVEARGLGANRMPPAYEQVAGFDAVSVNVGLVYEMPLTDQRKDATRAEAELAVKVARADLKSAQLRVRIAALTLVANLRSARAALSAAQKTERIAAKQVKAQQESFDLGNSTPIQVQEAQDQLRQAKLRVASARVTQARAILALDHATGALLRRYRGVLARR